MAGTVQRLIRHVWGFLVSPANIENKQQSFNEGDNGSGRDRTQLVAKGPTGALHTWITVDEIEDYVQSEINSSSSFSGVYVKVTTYDELVTALGNNGSYTIFCDNGYGAGLVIGDLLEGLSIGTGVKSLIGSGGRSLNFNLTQTSQITLSIPSGSEVNFIDPIDVYGDFSIFLIVNAGTGVLRVSEIVQHGVVGNYISVYDNSGNPDNCILEKNNTEFTMDEGVDMKYELWSGRYDRIWRERDEVETKAVKNTILKEDVPNTRKPEVIESSETIGTTSVKANREYKYSEATGTVKENFAKEIFSSEEGIDSASYQIDLYEPENDAIFPSLAVLFNYFTNTPDDRPYWNKYQYTVIQTGKCYLFSRVGSDQCGISYSCHNDGSNWRFDSSLAKPRIELWDNGEFKVYSTDDTPVENNSFTLVPVSTKKVYSQSLSSFSTASTGEIGGLTMTTPVAGEYLITFKCNVTLLELTSNPFLYIGVYKGVTKLDEMRCSSSTLDDNSTIRLTLNTTLTTSLSGAENVRFVIESVGSSPSASEAKVTAIQL